MKRLKSLGGFLALALVLSGSVFTSAPKAHAAAWDFLANYKNGSNVTTPLVISPTTGLAGLLSIPAFVSNEDNTGTWLPVLAGAGDGICTTSNILSVTVDCIASEDGSTTLRSDLDYRVDKRDFQAGSVTTDSNGNATLTFAHTMSTSNPIISATAFDTSGTNITNVQVVSKSATSTTVHVNRLASVLGILTLTTNASGVSVDITAYKQP